MNSSQLITEDGQIELLKRQEIYFLSNSSGPGQDYGFCVLIAFTRCVCTLVLRAALIMIQFACIPCTNVNMIILQNILDISCGTIGYCVFGFVFSFGKDFGGIIGTNVWIFQENADLNNAILGWSSVTIMTGLYTTILIGRLHYLAHLLTTLMISVFILPLILHWVWSLSGWMYKAKLSGYLVTYKDYGGGLIVHVSAGIVALINSLYLGRRLMKLQDLDEASIPIESPRSSTVGYLLLIISLIGFSSPSSTSEMTHSLNNAGIIFINHILAATGGISTVVILQYLISHELLKYWSIIRYLQGAIAGIVIVSSGIDVYNPFIALFLGSSGGLVFFLSSYFIVFSAIEDYANIIAIHLINGLLSTLLPPIFGNREGFGIADKVVIHLAWQIICDLAVIGIVTTGITILSASFKMCSIFRNNEDEINHRRAKTLKLQKNSGQLLRKIWKFNDDANLVQPGVAAKNNLCKGHAETSI